MPTLSLNTSAPWAPRERLLAPARSWPASSSNMERSGPRHSKAWQDVRYGFHILRKSPAPNADHGILRIMNRAKLCDLVNCGRKTAIGKFPITPTDNYSRGVGQF